MKESGDMINTGVIDTKHFLIALVAIVAIVALVFAMVFASGGFAGSASEGAAYQILENYNIVVMDWSCFKECTDMQINVDICKETCVLNP